MAANTKKKKHILDYAGAWSDMPEKEWKDFEANVREARIGINKSLKKRISKILRISRDLKLFLVDL